MGQKGKKLESCEETDGYPGEEKEYGGFFPYLQVYPRSRMPHLFSMNCVNRAGVLVPESVLNGAVKTSLQGPEMDAYGDELGEASARVPEAVLQQGFQQWYLLAD
ncbi:hypothetical protein CB1_000473012 [Camelus ferus]|nr:hypothetical protein CB1_000473012 [Camelus ferus]